MANARNQTIDKTFLSLDNAEDRGFIHRDYIAHCLRWTHVVKRLYERKTYQTARVLDIGCGRELPLAKLLHSSRLIPAMYYGVDAGPILDEPVNNLQGTKFPFMAWEKTNLLELTMEDVAVKSSTGIGETEIVTLPNVVVCFECFEHVEPRMLLDMLRHMQKLSSPDAKFFFSTPCWNRTDVAANHVNEMTYEALGAVLEREGFVIEHVHGTFASIRDYGHLLTGETLVLFNQLRDYYDTNFLSCVFAPMFPAQSRNVLWECRKLTEAEKAASQRPVKFKPLSECQQPWGSSALWAEMGGAS